MSGAADIKIAAVYARALLAATGPGATTVADELAPIAEHARENTAEWQALVSPQVPVPARKATLVQLHQQASATTRNFLQVLVDKGRIAQLATIHDEFVELVKLQRSELDVSIATAVELPPQLRERLQERLSTSTGKQVRLHTSVDPAIIGGLVVQHGDTMVDSSLRSRLEQLRLLLTRPATSGAAPASPASTPEDAPQEG